MQSSRSQQFRASTRYGGENLKQKCCRHSKNSESASFRTALWVEAFSRERSTKTLHSTVPISATDSRASRRRRAKRIRPWLIWLATSQNGRRRHLLRLRSRGCSHRSHGLFQSLARRSCIGWKKISEQPQSNLRRMISVRLRLQHPKS